MDEYNPINMLRRDIFEISLNYLTSKNLTEPEVVECLKNCIEFYVGGSDNKTIRDFCIAKVRQAKGLKK